MKKAKINWAPYLFISPYFLMFLMFSVFPLGFSFYVSMTEWNGFTQPVFVGLQNYAGVIKDTLFHKAVGNTFILMAMIIPLQLLFGLVVALFLTNRAMIWKSAFRLFNFLPYLTTPIAVGVIFGLMFDPYFGAVNEFLLNIGFIKKPIDWIMSIFPARSLVAIVTIWKYYGYTAVLFMAGIMNINVDLFEASDLDGANTFQTIWYITLPQLKQVTIFVVLTTLIGCFQIFEEPFMIFSQVAARIVGGPSNAVLSGMWLFYNTAFANLMRYGYASAIAFMLFVIIGIVTIVFNKLLNTKEVD